jgi:hypothetical protein
VIEFDEPHEDWLGHLAPTPKRVLKGLLDGGTSPEEAIELWLGGSHQANIAGMGGEGVPKKYSAVFMNELRLFICTDDPKYKDFRAQFPKINKGTGAAAISALSTAFASSLGVATVIIVPAIVLGLMTIAKVGATAWCERTKK